MQEKLRILIKKKRKKKGYTQEEVAKMLNYRSKSTYNLIENGPTIISTNTLKALSEILSITRKEIVDIFFEGKVPDK